jgi:hypothetical protein
MSVDFKRHSPSSLNLFSGCPSMFVLEKILGTASRSALPRTAARLSRTA